LAKAVKPGGVILVSTPNKHMFPSFNPYHLHEFACDELGALFRRHFQDVTVYGVFGDKTVLDYRTSKQRVSDGILKLDFLKLREVLPQSIIRALYGFVSFFIIKRVSFWRHHKQVVGVTEANFIIKDTDMERALDFIVVARA
jgi:hypothetical protein